MSHATDTAEPPIWPDKLLVSPHSASDKGRRVRRMFDAIAPRYELVNRVFSGGRDDRWRNRAVALASVSENDDVLDLACGTGDFSRAFATAGPRQVVGCDFSHEMLLRAAQAGRAKPGRTARVWARSGDRGIGINSKPVPSFCEADALCLPFADASFSVVSCAFGVRNFEDLDQGLAEMHRMLRSGGRAVILEFTRPRNRVLRAVYEVYANRVMPWAATWLSGDRSGAYRYLPRSVLCFGDAVWLCERLRHAGFVRCDVTPLTLGVVTVYVAWRDPQ